MNTWTVLHKYRFLARLGMTNDLLCEDCGTPLAFLMGPDDEPVLWCVTDDSEYVPGTQLLDDLRSVVNKYKEIV